MKIKELFLKNCKCYREITITFQEGINVISGANGAGKTTLIEAIGLALFNHLPYSARQFLRDGEKSGEVQVLIEALDEREYRIIRKFNRYTKSLKWEVRDEETDTALGDLLGIHDVSRWIKENIGVDTEDSLGKIYQQVIAVDQGLFTAPFLETGANRKRIFDQILKVEGYREAFEKSRSLKSFIEGEEKELKAQIHLLENDAARLPVLEEEMANKMGEEREKTGEYAKARQVKQDLEIEEARMGRLKEAGEIKVNEKKLLEEKASALEETILSLKAQREEAGQARSVLEETQEAFTRYQQNQGELKKWEALKKEKDRLRGELEKKEKGYATEERGIDVAEENTRAREEELKEKLRDLHRREKALSRTLEEAKEDVKVARSRSEGVNEMGKPFASLQAWLFEKGRLAADAFYLLQAVEEIEAQIMKAGEKIGEIPREEGALAEVSALLDQGEELLQKRTTLEARKEALKGNEAHLLEGRCPIIQEPCPSTRVAGDLRGFFSRELQEMEEALKDLKGQLEQRQEHKERYQRLKTRLDLARNEEKRMKEMETVRKDKLEELRRILASFPLGDMARFVQEGQREYRRLENLVQEVNSWIETREFMGQEALFLSGLEDQKCLTLLDQLENAPLEETRHLRAWLTGWDPLEAEVGRWLERGGSQVQKTREWLSTVCQDAGNRRQKVAQEHKFCQKEITNHGSQLDEVTARKTHIKGRKGALSLVRDEINKLKENLEKYDPVESREDALRRALERDQGHYDRYKENEKISERLEKIQDHINNALARAREMGEKIRVVTGELEALLLAFDPEKHRQLQEELKNAEARERDLDFALRQLKKDMGYLGEQLENALQKRDKWEKLNKRLMVKKKAGELAQTIRDTLNRAGDPIAQVYRRHISFQANEIHRRISNENIHVEWAFEYELQLKDNQASKERIRVFKQLSGGEQMTAALAIRLALMKTLSDVGVGFFDEPTTNLDATRRHNLAAAIQNATRGFEQLFVISHDDAFDALTENGVRLE